MADEPKKLLAAAKAGKLDKILALAGFDLESTAETASEAEDDAALTAFKWLLVAEDFGHDVDDQLEMLRDGTALHYDSDQLVEASIYFALGIDYLRGEGGLAVSHATAASHFATANELGVTKATDLVQQFARIRAQLTDDERAVFDAMFPEKQPRAAAKKAKPAATARKPAAKKPAAKKPAAKKPAARKPAAKKPAAKKPAAKKPVAKAKKPAAKKQR